MTLAQPEFLLLLPLFFILYIWTRRPRQWCVQPSRIQVRKASALSRLFLMIPLLCWLGTAFILVAALANPKTQTVRTSVTAEERVFAMCIDLSTSMGDGPKSTMEKVRALSLDFVQKRKGDAIAVAAYSGASGGMRGSGYARIISYPTKQGEHIENAINSLSSRMFGAYTAIGDGLFMSVLALTQPEARVKMGKRYDRRLLELSMDSLGTNKENLDYAREFIRAVDSQKGKQIILFTDGTFNTGIHPAKPIWLAKGLGIKIYFIAFKVDGPTGLSPQQIIQRKKELIEAVVAAGGIYRESADFEEIKKIYDEIHRANKVRYVVAEEPREDSRQDNLFYLAAVIFAAGIIISAVWLKIP